MNFDGWITVGTKLSTKQLEKDIKSATNDLKAYEREAERLATTKADFEKSDKWQEYLKEKEIIDESFETINNSQKSEAQKKLELQAQNAVLEELNGKYSVQIEKHDQINKKIAEAEYQQGLLKTKIESTSKELDKQKDQAGFLNIVKDIGKEVDRTAKKVVGWGLALFGIRSAYNAVRSAMTTITSQDEQLKADIDYMRNALAYTLEPVVRQIVEWMRQLMFYGAYLVKAFTGKNIFANANKGLKGATSSAKALNKELDKTVANFDEMTTVQDTSSAGGGGAGGAGVTGPSFDLANLGDFEPPKWLVWLKENGKLVAYIILMIAGAIVALKLGVVGIEALVIGLIVAEVVSMILGIIKSIKDLIKFLKDPTWDNFFQLIKDIPGTMGVAGFAVDNFVETILGGWDNVEKTLKPVADWMVENVIKPTVEYFQKAYDKLVEIFTPVVDWFKKTFGDVKENISIIVEDLKIMFQFLSDKIHEIFNPIAEWFKEKFSEAKRRIQEEFGPVVNYIKRQWDKLKEDLAPWGAKIGQIIGGSLKAQVNAALSAIDWILNTPINSINSLIKAVKKIPGLEGLKTLNRISIPRLAKGGIINMPGPGVAIGGEHGQEGVIPLTDSQQMALLGQSIGRYITIQATVPVYVGNRQIAREIRNIEAEESFAYNR